jgi:hydroxymethylpyrimidine/phosphomethylpyrimidine kinase
MESGIKSKIKPILLISASDSSAAAGIQNDIRVLDDLGVPGRCAVTALTVQGDGGAGSINPADPAIILDSISTALSDAPGIGAVKVGLLGDEITAEILADPLDKIRGMGIPVVVDPVLKSSPGSILSSGDTAGAILGKILPHSAVVTPNGEELAVLGAAAGADSDDEENLVLEIMGTGTGAVLVTGGDTGQGKCVDKLYETGAGMTIFMHPRIGSSSPRGTGCTLSTAIAAHLGAGMALPDAVKLSIDYVADRIRRSAVVGNQLLLFPGRNP